MLTLYNVTEAESGEYVCKVSNYIGEANQSAWLTVTRPLATGNTRNAWRWKTKLWALLFLLFLVQQPWKNTRRGWLCSVCVSQCPAVCPVCCPPHHVHTWLSEGVLVFSGVLGSEG